MTNKTVNRAIELMQESLSRFWQRDYKMTLQYMTDDVILIGSLQEQFVQGIDKVEKFCIRLRCKCLRAILWSRSFL